MALAIAACAYSGAEAQVCKTQPVVKHTRKPVYKELIQKVAVQQPQPLQETKTVSESCKMVPYDVCKINADRKSVSCFKTMDPDSIQPLNTEEVTTYGATGSMPGEAPKPTVETIIIKGPNKGDYCKRNDANNATICYHSGVHMTRDEEGYYHY